MQIMIISFSSFTNKLHRFSFFWVAFFVFFTIQSTLAQTIKTVGPGGDYTTLKAAFDAINTGSITGAIELQVIGNTTETATAVLNASGSGSANYTGIIISPSGGNSRIISGNLSAPLIDLNGADNVTIDGLNTGGNSLTLQNLTTSNASTASVFRFFGGATNNTITNCEILGSTLASSSGLISFSTSTVSGGNSNNTISFNSFSNAGGNRPLNVIYSAGTSGNENTDNHLINNQFYNHISTSTSSQGINIVSNSFDWLIDGNSFFETAAFTTTSTFIATFISVGSTNTNGMTISGNFIGGNQAQALGSKLNLQSSGSLYVRGIFVSGGTQVKPHSIQGNLITNMEISSGSTSYTGPTSAIFRGIETAGFANIGNVTGNIIGGNSGTNLISINKTASSTSSVYSMAGILMSGVADISVQNNIIGGIDLNATVNVGRSFVGIFATGSNGAFSYTIENNTIGSLTIAKSINTDHGTNSSNNPEEIYGIISSNQINGVIRNNIISNLYSGITGSSSYNRMIGISIPAADLATNGQMEIIGNTIQNLTSNNIGSNGAPDGINNSGWHSSRPSNVIAIKNNRIQNLICLGAGTGTQSINGIIVRRTNTSSDLEISGNFIENLVLNSTGTASFVNGITLSEDIYRPVSLFNNLIVLGKNMTNPRQIHGIRDNTVFSSTTNLNHKYYYNTIVITGDVNGGQNTSGIHFLTRRPNGREFKNNIIVNKRNNLSGSAFHYGIRVQQGSSETNNYHLIFENNCYYTPNTGGIISRFDPEDRNFVPFILGQDASSLNIDPQFANINGVNITDFTPQIRLQGVSISSVTSDILNTSRNSHLMGAIESCETAFTGSISANQVYCSSSQPNDIEIIGQTFASIQWQESEDGVNFEDILGATTNTLLGSTIGTLSSTRFYRAVIDDSGCVESYSPILEVVIGNQIFEENIFDQNLCLNCDALPYTINALGSGWTYQWYSNTTNATTGGTAISGATNSSYTPLASSIGSTYYYVELTNSCGTITNVIVANVKVNNIPQIISHPIDGEIGDVITIQGTGFSTNVSDNLIYISSVKALVINATPTSLEVQIPAGSKRELIKYTNLETGLSAVSPKLFTTKYEESIVLCQPLLNSANHSIFGNNSYNWYGWSKTADLNGDGFLDVVTISDYTPDYRLTAHMNTSSQGQNITFATQQAIGYNYFVKAFELEDLNGDGMADLIFLGDSLAYTNTPKLIVMLNQTTLNSTTVEFSAPYIIEARTVNNSSSLASTTIQLFDMDGDGKKDIVAALNDFDGNSVTQSIAIYRNLSSGNKIQFDLPQSIIFDPGSQLTFDIGDINNDGKLDIVYSRTNCNLGTTTIQAAVNNSNAGSLSFSNVAITSSTETYQIILADMDKDGNLDVVKLKCNAHVAVYKNNYSAGAISSSDFIETVLFTGGTYFGMDVGDISGDGLLDIVTGDYSNNSYYRIRQNLGTVSGSSGQSFLNADFEYVAQAYPDGRRGPVTISDFNNDGKPDIVGASSTNVAVVTNNCLGESAKMIFQTAPQSTISSAGNLDPIPVVQIVDGNDNPIAVSGVTIALEVHSGTSTVSGTLIRSTDANGRASFSGLSIPCATDADFVLRFVSPCIKDTLFSAPITANSVTLSGTIQVGTNEAAPFNDLITALQTYELADITGDVIFELTDASYNLGSNSAILRSNANADVNHTLTIKPAIGVTPIITSSNSNGTIIFYGTDFVAIDGSGDGTGTTKDLTIQNSNSSGTVLRLENLSDSCGLECTNLTIRNSVIMGNSITSITAIGINLIGTSHSDIIIENNTIEKCGYGISSTNPLTPLNNLNILNNKIGSNSSSNYIGVAGIRLARITNAVIANNTIFNISSTTTTDGGPQGVFISHSSASNINISNNHIYNIIATSTSGSGGKGIRTLGSGHTIYNNIIHSIGGVGSTTNTSGVHGIYIGSTNTNVYHNTVFLSGNYNGYSTAANISAAIYVVSTGSDIRNNIFHNEIAPIGKPNPKSYAIRSETTFGTIDYNNYFVAGNNGVLGFRTSDRVTLVDWQSATTQDLYSLDINPEYQNSSSTSADDYLTLAQLSGTAISGFDYDFLGNIRTNNKMGAIDTSVSIMWTGTVGSDWNNINNWEPNEIPSASSSAIIQNVTNQPISAQNIEISRLVIESGATLTINPTHVLKVTGTLNNEGQIIFKSDATGSGMFDQFTGTITGSGTVQVERYIPSKRAFRFVSPSVTTSTTIRQNWQENGGTTAGLGTHITGTGGATNGFDVTATNNPSMFGFNHNTGQWSAVTNTNVNILTAGTPYRLMVRGDRNTDLTTNTPTETVTTLRATGALHTGDFTSALNQTAEGYSFIGNPFQAPLDMEAALTTSTNMNTDVLYYWDPTLNTRGAYVTRTLSANSNNVTSDFTEILQPGQAVFVKSSAANPTMTISETHKNVAAGAAGVFRTSASNTQSNTIGLLRANLQATIDNQWQTTDAALALFATSYTWDVTQEDATKMNNLDEEVSFIQASTSLAIAKQNDANVTDELPIRLHQLRHTNYRWVFDLTNYNGNTPYLLDTEQNTLSVIEDGTVLPFTAGSDTANRFKIIFQSPLSSPDFTKQIVLYPNPGKGADGFYIAGVSSASVRLYNVVGQEIPVQSQANGQTLQVTPKASLSAGVYNVHITQDGTTAQVKWIVD